MRMLGAQRLPPPLFSFKTPCNNCTCKQKSTTKRCSSNAGNAGSLVRWIAIHFVDFRIFLSMLWYSGYICICTVSLLPWVCPNFVVILLYIFCIYCVCYSNSRLVEYIVFNAIPLLFQTDVCILVFLPHDGSCYRSVVSFLFIPMFVRLCLCVSYFCYCVNVVFIFFFCCEDTFENPQTWQRAKIESHPFFFSSLWGEILHGLHPWTRQWRMLPPPLGMLPTPSRRRTSRRRRIPLPAPIM